MSGGIQSESVKPVPKGHKRCFDCSGFGIKDSESCKVCKGKGYWNIVDMQDYHDKYPELCNSPNDGFCADHHIEPLFDLSLPLDYKKAMANLKEAKAFIKKHKKNK